MSPRRIQQRRIKGWRMPSDARSCARPSIYGNPFVLRTYAALARVPAADLVTPWEYEDRVSADGRRHDMHWPGGDITEHHVRYMTQEEVVATHRRALIAPTPSLRLRVRYHGHTYDVTVDTVRRDLTGLDLACFCPLDEPCHVDTLLWAANAPLAEVKEAAIAEYERIRESALRVAALHPALEVAHAR